MKGNGLDCNEECSPRRASPWLYILLFTTFFQPYARQHRVWPPSSKRRTCFNSIILHSSALPPTGPLSGTGGTLEPILPYELVVSLKSCGFDLAPTLRLLHCMMAVPEPGLSCCQRVDLFSLRLGEARHALRLVHARSVMRPPARNFSVFATQGLYFFRRIRTSCCVRFCSVKHAKILRVEPWGDFVPLPQPRTTCLSCIDYPVHSDTCLR